MNANVHNFSVKKSAVEMNWIKIVKKLRESQTFFILHLFWFRFHLGVKIWIKTWDTIMGLIDSLLNLLWNINICYMIITYHHCLYNLMDCNMPWDGQAINN